MGPKKATQPAILRKIDDGDAAKLRVDENTSISVTMFALQIVGKDVQMLLIREWSQFTSESTWKSPAGKMLLGEKWQDTVKRKFPLETGLTANSAKFCFGAEFSSTRREKHYKIAVLITDFTGTLSQNTDGKISDRKWFTLGEAEKKINMAQQYALPHVIEAAKMLTEDFALALMNNY